MLKKISLILLSLVGLVLLAIGVLIGIGLVRWDRTFEAPYPEIQASADSAVVEKGRYLAYGPAHCAYCHTGSDQTARIDAGEEPPMSGGYVFELPVGTFFTPNLTPDEETGIGRRTDGELARILRHGVRADGRAAVPFMEFHQMSDSDLQAVISFLRAQPAVSNDVPDHDINLVGKMMLALAIKPPALTSPPPAEAPPPGPTIERGAYLANDIAACAGCHTERSMLDGSYLSARFSGGAPEPLPEDPTHVFVPPNLTPDPNTGILANWTEEDFIARFRRGKLIPQSHMPWSAFAKMSDDDLRAIYRYLQSLEPVENFTGPSYRPRT